MTDLGDRMKRYEGAAEHRLMSRLPVLARLDGRAFHSFTRGLLRPFDRRLHDLMVYTTTALLAETGASVGYTQSDEITLAWAPTDEFPWFGARVQKMASSLASFATLTFSRALPAILPEKASSAALFDARVWVVPDVREASNAFLWREQDATKNSISMLGQAHFSHRQLHRKHSGQVQDMLHEKGINWNDCEPWQKRGTWVRRVKTREPFTTEELDALPPLHEARKNPELMVERTRVGRVDMPPWSTVVNQGAVLFGDAEPRTVQGR